MFWRFDICVLRNKIIKIQKTSNKQFVTQQTILSFNEQTFVTQQIDFFGHWVSDSLLDERFVVTVSSKCSYWEVKNRWT